MVAKVKKEKKKADGRKEGHLVLYACTGTTSYSVGSASTEREKKGRSSGRPAKLRQTRKNGIVEQGYEKRRLEEPTKGLKVESEDEEEWRKNRTARP